MRSYGLVGCLALCAATTAVANGQVAAAGPETVLVMPLKSESVDPDVLRALGAELEELLSRVEGFEVVSTSDAKALMEVEAMRQSLGCESADDACMAAAGLAGQADLLLSGGIGQVGDSVMLHLTLLEAGEAKVRTRATATAPRGDALLAELPAAVAQLTGADVRLSNFTLEIPASGIKAAVMPLTASGIGKEVAASLTQVVATELKKLEGFSIISQDEIVAMLQFESDKMSVGCDDSACFAEIGGALGVDFLVIGNVGRLDETYLVSLKLIDTREARALNRVNETFKGSESDLLRAARFAVYELVGFSTVTLGMLSLRIQPDEAEVELDGAVIAVGGATKLDTRAGKHQLQIQADGYYGVYLETYVEPDLTNTLVVELEEIPVPWYRKWWIWAGGVALVGGAVAGIVLGTQSDPNRDATTGSLELAITR